MHRASKCSAGAVPLSGVVCICPQPPLSLLRDPTTQLLLLDRVAGTVELAAQVRRLIRKARQLEDSLAELDELADEDERGRMQALCDSVGAGS